MATWRLRLRSLLQRATVDRELDDELAFYLDERTRYHVAAGLSADAARLAARRDLGSVAHVKDHVRDTRGFTQLDDLGRDVGYALRSFRRTPGFTAVAILSLGLGIGANTAIFTIVNSVLLQPLSYKNPERLVFVRSDLHGEIGHAGVAPGEIQDIREQSTLIEAIGWMVTPAGSLTGGTEMEHVAAATASDDFLPVLGVQPVLGRGLSAREDMGKEHVQHLLISYELWQRRYHGDPDIIGRPIEVNNFTATIVGVLPAGFRVYLGAGVKAPPRIDIWFPADPDGADRRYHYQQAVARLRTGATVAQAQSELDAIASRTVKLYPNDYPDGDFRFRLLPLQQDLVQPVRTALLVLFGAVGFVLLIACANIANLMLARAAGRQKEIAVRAALGASRWRVIRQLLTESVLLSGLGGTAGLLLARGVVDVLLYLKPQNLPRQDDIVLNGGVIAFTVGLSLISGILFGLAPAMHSAQIDVNASLQASSRSATAGIGGHRVRTALVAAQVALSLVLLIGAGLMTRTFRNLRAVDTGFDPAHVLTFRVEASGREFRDSGTRWRFYREAADAVRAQPGVESVSAIGSLPLDIYQVPDFFAPADAPEDSQSAIFSPILPDYFRTMRIPLLGGRDFTERDNDEGAAVAILDESLAKRLWPGENAIGQHLYVQVRTASQRQLAEVVGVAHHVPYDSNRQDILPVIYVPYRNLPTNVVMTVRVAGDPVSVAMPLKRLVEGLGGKRPVWDIRPMDDYVSDSMAGARFALVLLGVISGVAFVLSVIGIYGVVSYSVMQRMQEFAIRRALGAQSRDILKLALGWGVAPAAAGIVIGLLASLAVTRFLATLVFGVSTTDAVTYAAVSSLLFAAALLACYVPVRLQALRSDLKINLM